MPSPYSPQAAFELDPESAKAIEGLSPEMQEVAKRGLTALQGGQIPSDQHAELSQRGQAAMGRSPASATPPQRMGTSPYGVPGVPQAGPPTEAQAAAGMQGPLPLMQAGPPTEAQAGATAQEGTIRPAMNSPTQRAPQGTVSPFIPGATQLPEQQGVAPMSGLSNHQKLMNQLFDKASNTRPQGMAPDEISNQAAAISNIPIVKSAQEGLKTQEDMLNMQKNAPRSGLATGDLGGFMALQDHFLGSNLAASYKAPETASAQQKRIFDALQKIQTDRQALAGNVVSGIKATSGGTLGNVITTGGKTEMYQGSQDPMMGPAASRADKNVRALITGVKGDMAELNANNAATQSAQRMLASGGSILDNTFRDKFLKAMIGGRVTNYDLMRQTGDTALADRAEQVLHTMTDGSFSPKNRAEYQDALRIIQEADAHEAKARIDDWRDTGLTALQLDPARVEGALKVGHAGNFVPVSPDALSVSKKKSQAAVPGLYDGSYKLPHPTAEQKQSRLEFLQKKLGH